MNLNVDGIAGKNRYETAVLIAKKYFQDAQNIIVANSRKDADALVAGYLGTLKNAPILLVHPTKGLTETKKYMEANKLHTYVLGGEDVVSKKVLEEIEKNVEVDKDPEVEADLTAYEAALLAVKEADYTEASWTVYQKVVKENIVTIENTQEEVDTAAIVAAHSTAVAAVTVMPYKNLQ